MGRLSFAASADVVRTRRALPRLNDALRRLWRGEGDPPGSLQRVIVGRMLAVLTLVSGLSGWGDLLPPAPVATNVLATAITASFALLLSPVLWYLPWARWPRTASLVMLPIGLVLITVGTVADPNPYTYGLPFVTTFLWLGAAHRRGMSLVASPLAAVSYALPMVLAPEPVPEMAGSMIYTLLLCVVLGEALAWVMQRLSAAQIELGGRRSEARFRALVQNGAELVAIVAGDGTIHYCSPAVDTLLDRAVEAVLGQPLWDYVHPEDEPIMANLFSAAQAYPHRTQQAELRLLHGDGSWRKVEMTCSDQRSTPEIGGLVLNARDVTQRRALEQELAHRAYHDTLTELPNRALLVDRLGHALARAARVGGRTGVLFIDLDDFKIINDSLGHQLGDELLVLVSQHLRASIRPGDTAARLGGDEFIVLLEDLSTPGDARAVADRFLERLRSPIPLSSREVTIGASIGIALSSDSESVLPDDLLRQADLAMYAAKSQGKGRVTAFDPSMHERSLERMEVEADLRRALERDELLVFYQTIVELDTKRVIGVEALVRWQHPTRGLMLPDQFITVAEETGLIVPLGRWVLREACRQTQAWRQGTADPGLVISVNLSARQFQSPNLLDDVATALHDSRLPPACLKLEITESVAMEAGLATIETLQSLKGLGVLLAIDDFGTGYSSLAYLKRFPVDTLKVDRAFVDGLGHDPQDTAIVKSVVAMARALGLSVTAEGIETAAQLKELRALNCREGQGYYFSRPQPAATVTPLLTTRPLAPSRTQSRAA
jgi:diguanylate cyclase (GGDEF)-like protein/PAS domain S-box-containing protein